MVQKLVHGHKTKGNVLRMCFRCRAGALTQVTDGFEVLVEAPAQEVFDMVSNVKNLPLWDPGCTEARSNGKNSYVVYDKSFQQNVAYTVEQMGSFWVRLRASGKGFKAHETIEVRVEDSASCWATYDVKMELEFPYCLCNPCIAKKLNRSSKSAGEKLQGIFAHRILRGEPSGDEMFDIEL
jgi:hypothetical protein